MSGFEVAGLVLGIIPLLEQAFEKVKAFKQRCEDFHTNTKKIARVENGLKTVLDNLQSLQAQFGDKRFHIQPENSNRFENDFNQLGNTLTEVASLLAPISADSRKAFFRFTRANKINRICREIISNLEKTSDRLRHINIFLSTAEVLETGVGRVCERQDEIIDALRIIRQDTLHRSVREDTFTPSFVVLENPPIARACLDYTAVDEEGHPETDEARLKPELLRWVDIRHERNDMLAVVAAVGMPGVGKTCALRGLGAEKDLREIFSDGILYFSLGKDAGEADVRETLCSLVARTGGHQLSQELNNYCGENATDLILTSVTRWFTGRKCLFLLDDVWDGENIGSSVLLRLSTVIRYCDKCSGLVYTTRDKHINPFEAIVRFNPLVSNSPTCYNILVKASGFSREEIEKSECENVIDALLGMCNGLKMALVVVGRNVKVLTESYREKSSKAWESYASTIATFPRKLLREKCAEYESLYSQLSVALQTLSNVADNAFDFKMHYSIEEAFEALCVAKKQKVLPDTMLRRLWKLESEVQARELARHFARVSMVEIHSEYVDGRFVEGIYLHDLVHDFANYLADERQPEKVWVKGWEVWSLRLIQSYFAVNEETISNASDFYQWWEDMSRSDPYFRDGLDDTVEKIAKEFRMEDGQDLSKYGNEYLLVIRRDGLSAPLESKQIMVLFPLQDSSVLELHVIISKLGQERGVQLSALTQRFLVFACLACLRLNMLCQELCEVSIYMEQKPAGPIMSFQFIRLAYPVMWEYARNAVVRNWTYYEEYLASSKMSKILGDETGHTGHDLYRAVLKEEFPLVGVPLTLERLTSTGVDCSAIIHFMMSGCSLSTALEWDAETRGVRQSVHTLSRIFESPIAAEKAVIFAHGLSQDPSEVSSPTNSVHYFEVDEEWMSQNSLLRRE